MGLYTRFWKVGTEVRVEYGRDDAESRTTDLVADLERHGSDVWPEIKVAFEVWQEEQLAPAKVGIAAMIPPEAPAAAPPKAPPPTPAKAKPKPAAKVAAKPPARRK